MPRFILVDHSIERPGGHHYEYAVHMARAAREHGFEVSVATHVRFDPSHWPADVGQVLPLFPYPTYGEHSFDQLIAREEAPRKRTWPGWMGRAVSRWTESRRELDRARRLSGFIHACHSLWAHQPLTAGDHVFCATMSDFDMEGLVQFLEDRPESQAVRWHLQFHFDILAGRASDYATQRSRLEFIRGRFESLLQRVPRHRLHFYGTTREMADQYNQLQVAPFRELPYAVNPALAADAADGGRSLDGPLRVTCAGHARHEKGRQRYGQLIGDLWHDCLATGRAQLCLQGSSRKLRKYAPPGTGDVPDAINFVPHPLSVDQYMDLVRTSHIGLFLYDSERYRHRCSGVLVEMLTAGVPVVVPAGCWLGEQIAEPSQQHLAALVRRLPVVDGPMPLAWRASSGGARFHPTDGLVVGGSNDGATAEFVVDDPAATEILIECKWSRSTGAGSYLRIDLRQYGPSGELLDQRTQLAGRRPEFADPVRALFRRRDGATRCVVRVRNAFRDQPIATDAWYVRLLDASGQPGGTVPAGQVGLQAANLSEFAHALRDVIAHYEHYRRTAAAFATHWRQVHDPRHALSLLVETPGLQGRADHAA